MALQDLTPQLRTRLRRVERVVGLFVALATLLLVAGFVYYLWHRAKDKGWFIPHVAYHTYVMTAEGLKEGDPVMLMGDAVGEITEITPQPPGSWYKIYVGFIVRQPHYGYIWTDSKAKIIASGFLGARKLEVTTGVAGAPTVYEKNNQPVEMLAYGKRQLISQNPKGAFVDPLEEVSVAERAQQLVGEIEKALPNILAITNRLNTVLDNSATLLTNSTAMVTNSTALIINLDKTITQFQPVLSNATVITGHLTDPRGSLGEWLIPTNSNAEVYALLTNLNTQLTATLENVANITSNLNTQVQSNDKILSEISKLIVDTDNMVQGLKKHWMLRGVFKEEKAKPAKTNAPPAKITSPTPSSNFSPRPPSR